MEHRTTIYVSVSFRRTIVKARRTNEKTDLTVKEKNLFEKKNLISFKKKIFLRFPFLYKESFFYGERDSYL